MNMSALSASDHFPGVNHVLVALSGFVKIIRFACGFTKKLQ